MLLIQLELLGIMFVLVLIVYQLVLIREKR